MTRRVTHGIKGARFRGDRHIGSHRKEEQRSGGWESRNTSQKKEPSRNDSGRESQCSHNPQSSKGIGIEPAQTGETMVQLIIMGSLTPWRKVIGGLEQTRPSERSARCSSKFETFARFIFASRNQNQAGDHSMQLDDPLGRVWV